MMYQERRLLLEGPDRPPAGGAVGLDNLKAVPGHEPGPGVDPPVAQGILSLGELQLIRKPDRD